MTKPLTVLMIVLLFAGCSNNKGTNPPSNIGIEIVPNELDISSFSGMPESERKYFVVKNTNRDSMNVSFQSAGNRVRLNPKTVRLGPSAAESIAVWLDCRQTPVGTFLDTVAVTCSDRPEWVDMVSIRSLVAEGTTYVKTDSSSFVERYEGYVSGCHLWSMNASWNLTCYSSNGKSAFVSRYVALGIGTLGERVFSPPLELKPGGTLKGSLSFSGCGGPDNTGAYSVQVEVRIDGKYSMVIVTRR